MQAAAALVARLDGDPAREPAPAETRPPAPLGAAGPDDRRDRRARHLLVQEVETGHLVTGGSAPHLVAGLGDDLRCDCADHSGGVRRCKHILAVALHLLERAAFKKR